jgi:hypothetical protein
MVDIQNMVKCVKKTFTSVLWGGVGDVNSAMGKIINVGLNMANRIQTIQHTSVVHINAIT